MIITLIALFLRMGAIFYISNFDNPDLEEFGVIARNIVAGRGFSYRTCQSVLLPSAYMPPAYPFVLAGFMKVMGDNKLTYAAIQTVQAILGAMLCVTVYKIGMTRFTFGISFGAALTLAVLPVFVYAPSQFSAFPWYSLAGCLLFLFLLKLSQEQSAKNVILVGLTLGILMLFRAETLIYVPFIGLWIYFNVPHHKRLRMVFLPLLLSMATVMPWTVRNYIVLHRFVPVATSKGYALWRGNNPEATAGARSGTVPEEITRKIASLSPTPDHEVVIDDMFWRAALDFIKQNPGTALALALKKCILFWTFDPTYGTNEAKMTGRLKGGSTHALYLAPWFVVLPLFVIGLIITRNRARELSLFYLYFGVSTLVAMIFFVLPRYRLYVEPLILPFAATGLAFLWDAFAGRGNRGSA